MTKVRFGSAKRAAFILHRDRQYFIGLAQRQLRALVSDFRGIHDGTSSSAGGTFPSGSGTIDPAPLTGSAFDVPLDTARVRTRAVHVGSMQ